MAVLVVVGGHGGTSSKGGLLPPDLRVDRIAYVGLDDHIWTISPDGADEQQVSGEGRRFTWPTWSPDGTKLVYSEYSTPDDPVDVSRPVLHSYNTLTGRRREVFAGERGDAFVERDAPHYPFWSPDGRRLAFIGGAGQTLTLYVDDLRDRSGPTKTLDDGPMWLDWSPSSQHLLAHRGLDHILIDVQSGETSELGVESDGFGYNVPSWRPSGERVTVVAGDIDTGYAIFDTDISGDEGPPPPLVGPVGPRTAFLWSADGSLLAVTHSERGPSLDPGLGLVIHDGIRVYSHEGALLPAVVERDTVVAFFWSPDGTKLAYVTLNPPNGLLRWNMLEVATGSRWPLTEFAPSLDQLVVFRYFDQYARSHSLWSPDSAALVFSGALPGLSISASVRQQAISYIIVVGAEPDPSVRVIGRGYLGFWSPK